MSDYIDGLIEGSHKKTDKEHFKFAEAAKVRVKKGELAEAKRKVAAQNNKSYTFKPFIESL
jgi:hypothetical protein